MVKDSEQPRKFDVVKGAQVPPPVNGSVLGGIKVLHQQFASAQEQVSLEAVLNQNNESWSSLIEAVLEKVSRGILQGTWHYKYRLKTEDEISQSYYYGEAINGSYSVNFSFDLCASSLYNYYFVVKNGQEILIYITAEPASNALELEALLNEYWMTLKDLCEQAKALSALKIVNKLPD